MAEVSIVVPVFNPGVHLRPALASVREQTFGDWELIVVDDGSTEDLGWISREVPEARVLRQPNQGASVARNLGILAATSPLIALMDQDDLWLPAKLEHQVAALRRHPDVGLCYCDLAVFSDDPEPEEAPADRGTRSEPRAVLALGPGAGGGPPGLAASVAHFADSFVVPSTILYRRTALAAAGLLDPWLPFTGDFDLLLRVAGRSNALHLESTDVRYRTHDSNFSHQYRTGRAELRSLRLRYCDQAQRTGDQELGRVARAQLRRPRRLFAAQAFEAARREWHAGHRRATARHLLASVTLHAGPVAAAARDAARRARPGG